MSNRLSRVKVMLVAVTTLILTASDSWAQVQFVNFSDSDATVAVYKYSAGRISRPPGASSIAVLPEDYHTYSGWYKVPAGGQIRLSGEAFYITHKGVELNYSNELVGGLVRTQAFDAIANVKQWDAESARLTREEGYRSVNYQKLNGTYHISGDAYRMARKEFPFNYSSHKRGQHVLREQVPGNITEAKIHVHEDKHYGAPRLILPNTNGSTVEMTVVTQGKSEVFGNGEKGIYRGVLVVEYLERVNPVNPNQNIGAGVNPNGGGVPAGISLRAYLPSGDYIQKEGGNVWREYGVDGNVKYTFREVGQNNSYFQIRDDSRRFTLSIPKLSGQSIWQFDGQAAQNWVMITVRNGSNR